jgi:predicted DNA-binding transcriptional regulator AlpA
MKMDDQIKTPVFLNDYKVAEITGLSVQTLRNWMFCGYGFPYFKAGRAVRYLYSDVIEFMEQNKVKPSK